LSDYDFRIEIKGIEETCEGLSELPKRLVKHAFAKALAAASVPMVKALEARTPKHTGDLAEHLMTDIQVDAEGRGGRVDIGYGKEGYKARLVEFGHRMVGHKPAKKDLGKAVQPHPFMRPAAAESAEASVEAFDESINESVDQDISGTEMS